MVMQLPECWTCGIILYPVSSQRVTIRDPVNGRLYGDVDVKAPSSPNSLWACPSCGGLSTMNAPVADILKRCQINPVPAIFQ